MADQNPQDVAEPMEQDPIPAEPTPAPSVAPNASLPAAPVPEAAAPAVEPDSASAIDVDPVPAPVEAAVVSNAPSGEAADAPAEVAAPVELLVPEVKLESFRATEYERLQAKELQNGVLQVDEYIVLFLIDLLRFNKEATFTLYRAKQVYPKQDLIVNLWSIGKFLTSKDATDAINRTRALMNKYETFRPYLQEYISRLTVYIIFAVAKTYSTIQVKQLQSLLCYPGNFMEILEELQWPIAGSFVCVFKNNAVLNYATKHINTTDFGSFDVLPKLYGESNKADSTAAAKSVQKLIQVSDALSKIKMPPPKVVEGKENGEKADLTPPESV
uniref:CSN8_PSD8_EIF3K domain-containing protein n=1 Tax=Panagrellus redivivus TaxID=6233 RepID=A0A7E4VXM8_PANRE